MVVIDGVIKNLREKYIGEDSLDEKRGRKRHRKKAAKKKKKDDRCTRIAKRKYDAWPSAYASGAVVQCRRGKIWKGLKEDATDQQLAENQEYEQLTEETKDTYGSEVVDRNEDSRQRAMKTMGMIKEK